MVLLTLRTWWHKLNRVSMVRPVTPHNLRRLVLYYLFSIGLAIGLFSTAEAQPVRANNYVVSSTADSGIGSLRQALLDANAASGTHTITFNLPILPATITLNSPLPPITQDISITGSTQYRVTIDGSANWRIFYVKSKFTINNLTLANGGGNDPANPTIKDGGAIYNQGTLTITNSTFSNSKTTGSGGGISSPSSVTIDNSIITGNTATGAGGGIYSDQQLKITNTTIANNQAGYGGGIGRGGFATVSIYNSTISGNTATGGGGGIAEGGRNNSTFYTSLTNVTVANNKALNGSGGGIFAGISEPVLSNTIVAGNTATQGGPDIDGYITSGSYNLIGNSSNTELQVDSSDIGNIYNVDAKLGPLQDNGGGTPTHALLSGSPAIDAASNTVCAATPINNKDQRGSPRPVGAYCDIGAYESSTSTKNFAPLPATVRVATTAGSSSNLPLISNGNVPHIGDKNTVTIQVGGTNGIPNNAIGISGVLTNIGCTAGGNLRFWTGNTTPNSVNLNVPGANFALNLSTGFTTALDASGKVNLGFSSAPGNSCGYAVDVSSYVVPPASAPINFLPTTSRIADSLGANPKLLVATGSIPDPATSSTVTIQATGTNGIPAGATGIIGVLTNVGCTGGGNLRFWTGNTVPDAVNLNVPRANFALNLSTNFTAPLDSSGKVYLGLGSAAGNNCGYAVDVVAYTIGGLNFLPATARIATAFGPFDRVLIATGGTPTVNDTSTITIQATNVKGAPTGAQAVIGVLTNIGCTAGSNLRFWTGNTVPNAVNLNIPGANSALNLSTGFTAALDSSGKVYLGLGSAPGDSCGYAVDIIGYY